MLSKRLLEISKLIDKNEVVYDVGSDHGLLPCFLVLEGITQKAYASDNKEGPLNRAKENIKRFNLTDKVIPVLADGIEKISKDVNVITIAGMGFYTVKHILEDKDLSTYRKVIVQVNKNVKELRQFISDRGFTILEERVVYDEFYYEIVVFNILPHKPYEALEIEYGPINLKKREQVFIDYLNFKKEGFLEIYSKNKDESLLNKIKEIEGIIGTSNV